MKPTGCLLSIAMFLLPVTATFAQELSWQTILIKGEGRAAICNSSTVIPSYFGNSASFVFTNLAVNLQANTPTDPNSEFGACQVRTRITIPQGMYLESISHTVVGGAVKSQGARGFMRTFYFMQQAGSGTPAFPGSDQYGTIISNQIAFSPLEDRNDALLVMDGSKVFGPGQRNYLCQYTRQRPIRADLILRAAVSGQRTRPDQNVLISIDSADVSYNVGATLGQCP